MKEEVFIPENEIKRLKTLVNLQGQQIENCDKMINNLTRMVDILNERIRGQENTMTKLLDVLTGKKPSSDFDPDKRIEKEEDVDPNKRVPAGTVD